MTVCILLGDVLAQLRALPDDHFDCIVTSPPYWGLRDYGVAGQIGLEPTLGEHLALMVEIFRELRRVLKPTGTLWLNYGDCYATSPNGRSAADTKAGGQDDRTFRDKPFSTVGAIQIRSNGGEGQHHDRRGGVLKPKDLCMIPNRLAIALQDDGWWVRSENIWGKTNPMPESVSDRPGVAHEKVFMLTKGQRYFYDAAAVRQGLAASSVERLSQDVAAQAGSLRANGGTRSDRPMKAVQAAPHGKRRSFEHASPRHAGHICHTRIEETPRGQGRALRAYEPAPVGVWPMATRPFACELCTACGAFYDARAARGLRVEEARVADRVTRKRFCVCGADDAWLSHFATFPPELVERCLDAGCPTQACGGCGAPWVRQVEVSYDNPGNRGTNGPRSLSQRHETIGFEQRLERRVESLGFSPSCACDAAPIAARVLDPFGGAGTTALVADRRGADCTLIELNPQYATLALHRIAHERPEADIVMGAA